jgi:hypothetical protein
MSLEEGVKYVAAAYAIMLAVLVAYGIWSARRVSALAREAQLLSAEIERREAAAGK